MYQYQVAGLLVMVVHSGFKWLKPTKNKFDQCGFTSFSMQIPAFSNSFHFRSQCVLHIQNLSNHCIHKYDPSISRIFQPYFGGFLRIGPTVWCSDTIENSQQFSAILKNSQKQPSEDSQERRTATNVGCPQSVPCTTLHCCTEALATTTQSVHRSNCCGSKKRKPSSCLLWLLCAIAQWFSWQETQYKKKLKDFVQKVGI